MRILYAVYSRKSSSPAVLLLFSKGLDGSHTVLSCLHIGICGLPRLPNGNDCVLTVTNKYTKQIRLIPGKTTWTVMDWARALLKFLMSADWGFPMVIISDRDKKFLSELWQVMFTLLMVALYFTTAYHPQADGQSERTNQMVELMIQHISQDTHDYHMIHQLDSSPSSASSEPQSTTLRERAPSGHVTVL